MLNNLAKVLPEIVGGSADLTGSNYTNLDCSFDFQKVTGQLACARFIVCHGELTCSLWLRARRRPRPAGTCASACASMVRADRPTLACPGRDAHRSLVRRGWDVGGRTAMAAICNGLYAYGGLIPFCATFLTFIGSVVADWTAMQWALY